MKKNVLVAILASNIITMNVAFGATNFTYQETQSQQNQGYQK